MLQLRSTSVNRQMKDLCRVHLLLFGCLLPHCQTFRDTFRIFFFAVVARGKGSDSPVFRDRDKQIRDCNPGPQWRWPSHHRRPMRLNIHICDLLLFRGYQNSFAIYYRRNFFLWNASFSCRQKSWGFILSRVYGFLDEFATWNSYDEDLNHNAAAEAQGNRTPIKRSRYSPLVKYVNYCTVRRGTPTYVSFQ